jgi:hypothetical protein
MFKENPLLTNFLSKSVLVVILFVIKYKNVVLVINQFIFGIVLSRYILKNVRVPQN